MTTINPSKHTSSKSSKKRSAHKVHTLPLATMAALLTAATCLGSQPAMAVPTNTITTPTYTATAKKLTKATGVVYQDRETDVVVNNPEWLKTPSILEFQRYRSTNDENKDNKIINSDDYGSDEHNTLIKKTDMYAHIETIDGAKYLVFDVFFNNDAQSMVKFSKRQWYIWQVPYQIAKLKSDGLFENDTIRDLRFDAYKLKDASQNDKLKRKMNFTLSRDFAKFEKVDNQSTTINFPNDSEKNFGVGNPSRFQYSLGPNLTSDSQYEANMKSLFHENYQDYAIGKATYPDYPYSSKNYGIGIQTSEVNLAFHMHAAVKLNSTAINENAKTYDEKYANIHNAWTWADSATYGRTTSSSYAWVSGRDPESENDKKLVRHKDDSKAPKIYYNGNEITDSTKTIKLKEGDTLSFTTTDNKGHIEKFSISGLTDTPITKQGAGTEDEPLPSGDITVTNDMNKKEVTITSEDGSGNVTTRKVKVKVTKKPKLSKEHPLTGKTITTTVGEQLPPLTKIDNFVTVKDGNKLDKQPTLSWKGTAPNTDTVGVFTHSIEGTYSDNSTSPATVTIKVKPKKPVIDTDLTNLAGRTGQKVTVSVGDGIPEGTTTTVKLFDKNGKEIGSTTTINNGKAEITVNDGIPEGDVYATTTVKKPDKKDGPKKTIPGFELISENSDKKQATAPKDNEKPTITVTADSLSVAVGQDLKIHIVAKDDVKVEEVPNAKALMQGLGLELNELSSRIKSSQTTNTDKEKDFDLTVKNMQPKEVGTHTITFTVKDSAGNTGTTTLTITVNPAAPTVTPKDDGSVEVTPAADTDTLEITYTPEGENTNPTNFTVKKENGKWKKGDNTPDGVTVDENTGKVTIPANKVKDGSDVKAKDKKGNNTSSETTGKAGNNDGNSGSGDSGSGSETGNSNSSESDSGNDSKSNNAGNASTGASGSNASTKSDNRVPAKHSSQLVKTGAEVERVGLISAMIGILGAAAAFFSRKKNRE